MHSYPFHFLSAYVCQEYSSGLLTYKYNISKADTSHVIKMNKLGE